MSTTKKTYSIRLEDKIKAQVDASASLSDRTASAEMRQLIILGLEVKNKQK